MSTPVTADDRSVQLLSEILAALKGLAAVNQPRESKKEKAIRLLIERGPNNLAAIARECGLNRSTLYRHKPFMDAVEAMQIAAHYTLRQPRAARFDEL